MQGNTEESFKHGWFFKSIARLIGLIFTVLGAIVLLSFNIIAVVFGAIMLVFGLYMLTGNSGIDIDYKQKLFKEYNQVAGIKFGEWKSLDDYPFLTVLKANKSNKASDITGLNKTISTNEHLGVYLLTNSHRKKILLSRTSNRMQDATAEATRIAELTDKEMMKYNPRRFLKPRH
ncbi:DUF308 domain-containing protein [Brumimicrobium aurantiacum]|uniref:Uncharacterized protein n=1 Tax=Brumimicrobium aurantiacum TaxID=1737063 RepID=A0A3E1F057_9FLAO|nr:DUF308 domain-containing protein [Brumimicrobium aurantiacum]RFC55087.1 hypothetical protein DXU93_04505 [Brumimicrobium aurantiacum]